MALILPRSVFFHIPKTGGSWVRQAVKNAGIPSAEGGQFADGSPHPHSTFKQVSTKGKFTFAFVRNPIDWYPSYWSFWLRRTAETGHGLGLLNEYLCADFEIFMRAVLRDCPGFLSNEFQNYVGPAPGVLDFVGKQEDLARDLIKALKFAGEKFDEAKILATSPHSVTKTHPVYPPDILRALVEAEYRAMERFGYLLPLDFPLKNFVAGLTSRESEEGLEAKKLSGTVAFGTSMLPFFKPTEEVWSEPLAPCDIRVGDVITFQDSSSRLVTHRVVEIFHPDTEPAFRTKGDNRLNFDPVVLAGQVVGKVTRIGTKDLTQPFWRLIGKWIAFFSRFQANLYRRLATSAINRLRHILEERGYFPPVRFRELIYFLTNPLVSWSGIAGAGSVLRERLKFLLHKGHIRPWSPQDGELMTKTWNNSFPDYPVTIERLQKRIFESPWFDPSGYFMATQNGKMLGWVWASLRKDGICPWRTGYLEVLAVPPSLANGKLSAEGLLIREAMKWLRRRGARQIVTGPIPAGRDVRGLDLNALTRFSAHGFILGESVWELRVTASNYKSREEPAETNPFVIRSWQPQDEGALREFFERQKRLGIEAALRRYLNSRGSPKNILIAQSGDRVIGFCRISLDSELGDLSQDRWIWWAKEPKLPTGYFFHLTVDSEYRGRGVETALSAHAFNMLFQRGARQICCWTTRPDFYEKFGFIPEERFVIMRQTLDARPIIKKGKRTMAQGISVKEKRYLRRPDYVVWKVIEDKGILLNLEDGAYFEVDPVGLAIWRQCDGKTSPDRIAESIREEFHASPERVSRDFDAFVAHLKRRNLLELSEAPRAVLSRRD